MAVYTVLCSDLQGIPTVVTLSGGTTIVSHASGVTVTQAGTGYFYQGASVDQSLISGTQAVINNLIALGAIG
jgi:hypothetical protein